MHISTSANPSLRDMFERCRACLESGGSIFGYYGSGKSLISLLYSFYKSIFNEPCLVIEANVVLRYGGDVRLVDISPTFRALNVLSERLDSNRTVAEVIASWLSSNEFDRRSMYSTLDYLRKIGNESLKVEGSGFQKLINISNILEKKYKISKIVFDEFERVIVNYEAYGYNSINSLVEDFFIFVDRKSPNISLALPHTYRAYIDIEILSRIQPSTNIVYDVDKLSIFFKNLLEVHARSSKVDRSKILNEYNMVRLASSSRFLEPSLIL